MHCRKTGCLVVPLKKREFRYPQEFIIILFQKAKIFGQLNTKRSQYVPHYFIFVCSKQKQVSGLSVHRFNQRMQLFLCHKLCKRRFVAAIRIDDQVRKTLCAVTFCKFHQSVNLLARHAALSVCVDPAHAAARCQCVRKHGKSAVLY